MGELSTFDKAMLQRHMEREQNAIEAQETERSMIVPVGYSGALGKICIVAGTLLLFPTGGLSGFLIFAGAMGLLGQRTSTKAHEKMKVAGEARDVAAVDRAFAHGVLGLIGWFVLGGFILLIIVSLMGVTL